MSETLEQRALRLASDLESRDMEAAEVLRALVRRESGPATEVCRRLVEWSESENDADYPLIRVVMMAKSLLAEHEPAKPARSIRGDSRTDDAGRWQGLESGVDT